MNWKSIIPQEMNISNLSLDDYRNFKELYQLLSQDVEGPEGFRIFYPFLHFLLFYTLACVQEKKFPALTRCWNELYPLFGSDHFNEWLFYTWLCCDFPLSLNSTTVILDEFLHFFLTKGQLPPDTQQHLHQFHFIMKASRLGLYQETSSTATLTTFTELFTHQSLSTLRSIPDYEAGEIFLTRLVSYQGDLFQIHDPQCYPPEIKPLLIQTVNAKLEMISNTGNKAHDYAKFMKLAGPYWMSCTHPDLETELFSPIHFKTYYALPFSTA